MSAGRDQLLTPAETAEYLATTTGTLAKWRYRGDGPPYVKAGRSVRYRTAALSAWVKAREVVAS